MADENDDVLYDYPVGKAKSKVWLFFAFKKIKPGPPTKENLDMSKVYCRLCKKAYANKGNTTNFQFHLQHDHPHDSTGEMKKATKQPVQAKLSFAPPRLNSDRQAILDDALLKLLVGKVLPLSLVENKHFKTFVDLLDNRYKLPSRRDITRRLEKKKDEVKDKVRTDLETCDNVSITHDSWTSLKNESYETVTAHFIDNSWTLKTAVLGAMKVEGSHTAQNISTSLKKTQAEWNLKTPIATTDNAANERKAFELLNWTRFGCFGHRLNLVVKHALSVSEVAKVLGKGRKLVTFFHSSPSVSGELLKKQKLLLSEDVASHKLIMDVPTRWNSTLAMLKRLCELTPAVISLVTTSENTITKAAVTAIKNNAYNFEEHAIVEKLVSVLEPFQCATEILCAEKIPTMHKVLPVVIKLSKEVAANEDDPPVIRAVKSRMREAACALNPYRKNFDFMPTMKAEAHDLLMKLALTTSVSFKQEMPEEVNNNEPVLPQMPDLAKGSESKPDLQALGHPSVPKKAKAADTEDWLDDVVCTGVTHEDPTDLVEAEVSRYLGTKVDPGQTVLGWWRDHEESFPRLSKLAKKYLCCQASSVSSERVFSLAGQVVSKKRCRMNPDLIDQTIFLNKNLESYW
ncbi:ZBED1-like protein [Mya arenaria]|uniref:ZBED1-like protein n=1 Tax=Mya arenaria TaxID=6604 RepID=A0ABY7G753_MYAAR|nr:E3 SUMO-protein ligase ZBED1-like [Mya arenaria]WAR27086.1 ZBED1-like protein [Mya arenaria]